MDEEMKTINLGGVNVYLLRVSAAPGRSGDGFVLVDTGVPWSWGRLRDALVAEGCLPGTLRLVALTHGDIDHAGGCANLRREYGAPIAIHRGDLRQVETGAHLTRQSLGLQAKLVGLLGDAMFKLRRSRGPETFTPDVLLEDGQNLAEYGWAARVVHIPGHTKGSVAFLTDSGRLFSGDTLFDMKHPPLFVENRDDFRASVAKLLTLRAEVKMVYTGHSKPFPAERMGRMKI